MLVVGCAGGGGGPEDATRDLFADIADDEPGCSVAVGIDGEVVFAEAYGAASLEPLVPFEPGTLVDVGSSAKQLTAMAVGLLVLDGAVGVDDPVADHVDGLPPWAEEVTVAQLLTHTSGIPDYIDLLQDDGVGLGDPSDQADALEVLTDVELEDDPGTTFSYSNSNYLLLAEVVASADGRDLPTFLADEVLAPLDVAAQVSPGVALPGMATSYELDDGWVVADSPWTQVGDGGVQTTPTGMVQLASAYWRDSAPWSDLAELRDEVAVDADDGRYSLGIEAVEDDGDVLLAHAGSWGGFETLFLVDPERRAAVALTCNSPDVAVDLDGLDAEVLDLWR